MFPAPFDPSVTPYVTLLAIGFVIGVVGHIYQSKLLILTGLFTIYCGILFLPLLNYLR